MLPGEREGDGERFDTAATANRMFFAGNGVNIYLCQRVNDTEKHMSEYVGGRPSAAEHPRHKFRDFERLIHIFVYSNCSQPYRHGRATSHEDKPSSFRACVPSWQVSVWIWTDGNRNRIGVKWRC